MDVRGRPEGTPGGADGFIEGYKWDWTGGFVFFASTWALRSLSTSAHDRLVTRLKSTQRLR